MAVRGSMADLIARIRLLISDPSGAPTFADQEIQDTLDQRREVVRYAALRPEPTPQQNTGVIQYLDYYATRAFWESDAALYGPAWQLLAPATSDYLTGHWTFAASQIPTVWIVGKMYDVYGAAADLLEIWAAKVADQFDFTDINAKYLRSQIGKAKLALAATYRAQAWTFTIEQVRDDVGPFDDYGQGRERR